MCSTKLLACPAGVTPTHLRASLTAVGADRKVAPHVGSALKLDALDGARRGLEAFVGVLRRDARLKGNKEKRRGG